MAGQAEATLRNGDTGGVVRPAIIPAELHFPKAVRRARDGAAAALLHSTLRGEKPTVRRGADTDRVAEARGYTLRLALIERHPVDGSARHVGAPHRLTRLAAVAEWLKGAG